jgi:hypothetical protein
MSAIRGKKVGGRHKSHIPFVAEVLNVIKPLKKVNKITLGFIQSVKSGRKRITIREDSNSGLLRIQCRGNTAVQVLWVQGDKDAIDSALKSAFANSIEVRC